MVHPGMVGITELMMDDRFAGWMENQPDDLLDSLSTYEVYTLFCTQSGDMPSEGDTIN